VGNKIVTERGKKDRAGRGMEATIQSEGLQTYYNFSKLIREVSHKRFHSNPKFMMTRKKKSMPTRKESRGHGVNF